jgi:6-phosphogluconolactonase
MTAAPQAGWLALHPAHRFLYAVHEVREFAGRPGGAVSAFAVDQATGRLTLLNTTATTGRLPCHCTVDKTGRYLLVATHMDGTVELFRIETDGRLGPVLAVHRRAGSSVHPRRQASPHPHSVNLDPAGRFALVVDLGTDQVAVYELDTERGMLTARPERDTSVAPGSGPRHLAFHPGGRFAYLLSELAATVTSFAYQPADGTLRAIQTVGTLPGGFTGHRAAAEVAAHPSGRFLFASNRSYGSSSEPPERGEDSVAWFAIDQASGLLTPQGQVRTGGDTPRSFAIDPAGQLLYVANQRGGHLEAYLIDQRTGSLSRTGPAVEVPQPVCVLPLP